MGFLAAALSALTTYSAEIYAGFASTDITPPIGGQTTGYSDSPPTDGIHDPIIAQVLILKTGDKLIAMAVCDLCIFNSSWLHKEVRALGIDHFLLMNTHTHAGPNMRQEDFPTPEKPWSRTVEERVLEAVKEARESLFPAYIAVSEGELQLGYNRLVRQPEGYSVTHFRNPERIPYGPVDPTVSVMRINDELGAVRLVLVSYACHPVVLGPENSKISAGYPGVLRGIVEEKIGGNVKCIFIQGGGGDVNPLMIPRSEDPVDDFDFVEKLGTLLSEEVLSTLDRMSSHVGKSEDLKIASKVIEVEHRFEADKSITLGTASILINGEIGIVTMPGEPFHLFQHYLRKRAALPHTIFFGYCSNSGYDWPSYMPDVESAARGGYGASDTTRAAVGAGELLLNIGLAQLYKLRGMLKDKPQRHIFEEDDK
jgi:hypothetical protein